MKNLKTKLMSAVAMLTVSAVMLVGTSFAWYTLSTNPEVKGIKVNVSANENLEIALDNGYASSGAIDTQSNNSKAGGSQGSVENNPYTWGNLVDLSYAFGAEGINNKLTLKPVAYKKTGSVATLQFPEYGDDGRITDAVLSDLTGFSVSDLSTVTAPAASNATDYNGVTIYGQSDTKTVNGTFDALSMTYWLRSNMNTAVSLSDSTKRAASDEDVTANDDPNDVTGGGSYISIAAPADTGSNAAEVAAAQAANAKLFDWLKNGKLTIQIDVVNPSNNNVLGTHYAYPYNGTSAYTSAATAANEKYTYKLALSSKKDEYAATSIDFTANTAQMLTTYVYLDGALITNADALIDDLTDLSLNIQFKGTNIDDAMDAN